METVGYAYGLSSTPASATQYLYASGGGGSGFAASAASAGAGHGHGGTNAADNDGSDSEDSPQGTTFAIHHSFQCALANFVHCLQVKDKRFILANMRRPPPIHPDCFLPSFGMTVGEFSTFNVLAPGVRKSSGSRRSSAGAGASGSASAGMSAGMSGGVSAGVSASTGAGVSASTGAGFSASVENMGLMEDD